MPAPGRFSRLYNHRWRAARRRFLAERPLCSMCEEMGVIAEATVVDHIRPHKGDLTLFWSTANWQPLCQGCHESRKKMLERGGRIPPHSSWSER